MSWGTKLSEPIALKGEKTRFRTLRDAATFLQDRYASARSGALDGAVTDLMAAAENSSPENVARATDQFARFLSQEGLIDPRAATAAESDIPQRIADMLSGRSQQMRREAQKSRLIRKRPSRVHGS